MQVVHFHRKVIKSSNYSIEGFYKNIRNTLKDKLEIEYQECKYYSNGFFKRLYNTIDAACRQKDVNHITGDVNYLNLFFRKDKNIVTILDCGLLDRLNGIKQIVAKFLWYSIPIARAKYVVAISQATKDEILKYVKCDPDKIKVIHVSVSPVFHRVDKEFDKQKPIILHIGTDSNKNLLRLIKAISGVICKLHIVGVLSNEVINELNQNNIDYANFTHLTEEEVFERYKESDMLAFVSTYEGFGMPIVEANAVGRPVITSHLLSMPEVANDAACIVDPYKIEEIRNGILKIINDDKYRADLISNGYENTKRFSLEKIADEHLRLYKIIYDN